MGRSEQYILEHLSVHNIPGILMGLYYDGVISRKEQLNINSQPENEAKVSQIFYILKKTDAQICERILRKTRNEILLELISSPPPTVLTREREKRLSFKVAAAKNPMLLELILAAVFNNLNLKDLKTCRFVSRKWNFVCEPILRKLSRIKHNIASNKTSEMFTTLFESSQTDIPFTAFRLMITQERNWPIDVAPLETFFEIHGKDLEELTMFHVNSLGDKLGNESPRELLSQYDMNPFISVTRNLTELNVVNTQRYDTSTGSTQLTFSTDHLLTVKKLYLVNCTINVVRRSRLRPIEIYMYDVTLTVPEQQEDEVLLNNLLDLNYTRSIKIHLWSYCTVKLILDCSLGEMGNLDFFDVHRCEVQNWDKASGRIYEFKLSSSLFCQHPPNMKVKEMLIDSLPFVNLSSIPESVEKLSIRNADIVWSFTNNFPQLKYLQLYNNHILNLYYFKCCPQLVSIELRYRSSWSIEIKMDWLPIHVKNIWLKGNIKISSQKNMNINTLILDNVMSHYFTKKIFSRCKKSFSSLKNFKANKIVVNDSEYLVKTKAEFLSLPGQLIVVGPFDWGLMKFSSISKYVDRKAEFYVFEKQKGRGIEEDEFEEFMKL